MTPDEGVRAQESSREEIAQLFAVYRRHVSDASVPGTSIDGVYSLLFDGGLTLAKIVVRAHGLRVTGSHMSREIALRLCASILGRSGDPVMAVLEGGRRKRNRAVYDEVGTISRAEAASLRRAITDFEILVRAWLAREHPDLLPPELPLG